MADIKIATGVEKININDKVPLEFNPTDAEIVEKIFDVFNGLADRQRKYQEEVEKNANKKEIFEIARRESNEMRDTIDSLFGVPLCTPLFGSMNVLALADGLPVWSNLMLGIIDQIDTTFAREQKAMNPRIKKYMERWKK